MLTDIQPGDYVGVKWAKLQAWVRQACVNAGVAIPTGDAYLTDITGGETEGLKWAKLGRWVQLLAEGVGGGSSPVVGTPIREVEISGAFSAADAGYYIYTTSGDDLALLIPADVFTVGTEITLFAAGEGVVSIVTADTVTLISKDDNFKLAGPGAGAVLKYVGSNIWHLVGDLVP